MDGDIFVNATHVDAEILYGYKKMRFQKYPDTCGRGLRISFSEGVVMQRCNALNL